jgi:hypothetical protein
MFLQGAGGVALAIPLLSSLLPRKARSAGQPVRYLQWGVGFGDYDGPNSGNFAAYLSDSARRSPLPYLFKG